MNHCRFLHSILCTCIFFSCALEPVNSKSKNVEKKRNIQEKVQIKTDIGIPLSNLSCKSQQISHFAYTVDYNSEWHLPNWVAYVLTKDHTNGSHQRLKSFSPDPQMSNPVYHEDYTNNLGNYDRGHMAPAADMKWSEQAMRECFYMTNVCPQNRNLNRGDWNDLEELARDWARKYGEIYIVCGPLVSQNYRTIGQNKKIAIPNAFFKVFLRQTDTSWTAIGFVMPNQAGNRPLMTYILSIDEVEQLSGIDFFYNLPDCIEDDVEKEFSIRDWNINVRRK